MIPFKHAQAFITSLSDAPIENYVDLYYSIEKFRVAYSQLIPAMSDKSQWPKSNHKFFMHPPLLTPVAGRPKLKGTKVPVTRKRENDSTSALFVWTMDIIGIIAREADQKTLKL